MLGATAVFKGNREKDGPEVRLQFKEKGSHKPGVFCKLRKWKMSNQNNLMRSEGVALLLGRPRHTQPTWREIWVSGMLQCGLGLAVLESSISTEKQSLPTLPCFFFTKKLYLIHHYNDIATAWWLSEGQGVGAGKRVKGG